MHEDHRESGGNDGAPRVDEAYSKAVDLLASRAHFTAELALKLRRRGFARTAIDEALARLTRLGYLDDLAAARSFAQQRAVRQGWGPVRLRAELERRRVASEAIETVVGETFVDGEPTAARAAAARWVAKGGSDRDRLGRYLDRRGFSRSSIVEILSGIELGESSDHEEY